jgi:hypothetical protein
VQNLFQTGFFASARVDGDFEEQDVGTFATNDESIAKMVDLVIELRMKVQVDKHQELDDVVPTITYPEVVATLNAIGLHVQHNQDKMVKLNAFAYGVLDSYQRVWKFL